MVIGKEQREQAAGNRAAGDACKLGGRGGDGIGQRAAHHDDGADGGKNGHGRGSHAVEQQREHDGCTGLDRAQADVIARVSGTGHTAASFGIKYKHIIAYRTVDGNRKMPDGGRCVRRPAKFTSRSLTLCAGCAKV